MTLHARIEDCKWALGTCRNLADLRDVWGNVWRHWSGAVPQAVTDEKERLKRRMERKKRA